jgi:hypothetical protein
MTREQIFQRVAEDKRRAATLAAGPVVPVNGNAGGSVSSSNVSRL